MFKDKKKSKEEIDIKITSVEDAVKLISDIHHRNDNCKVTVTDGRSSVDGHSLLGVLSLDLSKGLKVIIEPS